VTIFAVTAAANTNTNTNTVSAWHPLLRRQLQPRLVRAGAPPPAVACHRRF
jgi:hypothetical protein